MTYCNFQRPLVFIVSGHEIQFFGAFGGGHWFYELYRRKKLFNFFYQLWRVWPLKNFHNHIPYFVQKLYRDLEHTQTEFVRERLVSLFHARRVGRDIRKHHIKSFIPVLLKKLNEIFIFNILLEYLLKSQTQRIDSLNINRDHKTILPYDGACHLNPAPRRRSQIQNPVSRFYELEFLLKIQEFVGRPRPEPFPPCSFREFILWNIYHTDISSIIQSVDIKKFQKVILDWYRENRRDFPWRRTKDPYEILVSEIMLQQTQVSRVLPKYKEFLKAFPTLEALAKTPDKKLMAVWSGLGYWRRAKYLKETARILVESRAITGNASKIRLRNLDPLSLSPRQTRASLGHAHTLKFLRQTFSAFPSEPRELEKLPGIGHYTARALACFAFGSKEAFLDTNIRRVYLHFFFPKSKNVPDKKILEIAQKATTNLCHGKKLTYPGITPKEWHYALFDYGALVLKNKSINKRSRHYHKQSKFEGSFRSFRTKAVRFILAHPKNKVRKEALEQFLQQELVEVVDLKGQQLYTPTQIIDALLYDNLIKKSKTHYSL